MNDALVNISQWFGQNKLNLNPSKTRYLIFNSKSPETKLIKVLHDKYIKRVWKNDKEKSRPEIKMDKTHQHYQQQDIMCNLRPKKGTKENIF